jgi:hypothetical protein
VPAKQGWLAASHLLLLMVLLMTCMRANRGLSDITRTSHAGTLSTAVAAAALEVACGTHDMQTAGS